MNLSGKVALITGGARIGHTVAEELARKGCRVALTYRSSREAALKTVARSKELGSTAIALRCDVTSETAIKRAVAETAKRFGRLDVVVNMASTYRRTPYADLTRRDWERAFEADLSGAHLVTLHAAPHLRKRGGRVVNIADWLAASGRPRYNGFVPYYTAKKAVVGLTEAQALELAPRVLVNAIAPGPIEPPKGIANEEVRGIAKVTPLGRWGGAAEIARAVIFLCETDFVTGECVRVDGGRHLL